MPQMSPLLWLNLFLLFAVSYLLVLVLNHYIKFSSKPHSSTSTLSPETPEFKWRW